MQRLARMWRRHHVVCMNLNICSMMNHTLSLVVLTLALFTSTPTIASIHADRMMSIARDHERVMPLDTGRTMKRRTRGALIDTAAIRGRLLYPQKALDSSISGGVSLHLHIAPDGSVSVISMYAADGSEGFIDAIDSAIGSGLKSTVARVDDAPVADTVLLLIEFVPDRNGPDSKGGIIFTHKSHVASRVFIRDAAPVPPTMPVGGGDPLERPSDRKNPSSSMSRTDRNDNQRPPNEGEYVDVEVPPTFDEGELVRNLKYPESARRKGVEGRVVVRTLLDRNGRVVQTLIDQSAAPELDECAANAIRQTRFTPALLDGKPVAIWIQIPIDFNLDK